MNIKYDTTLHKSSVALITIKNKGDIPVDITFFEPVSIKIYRQKQALIFYSKIWLCREYKISSTVYDKFCYGIFFAVPSH